MISVRLVFSSGLCSMNFSSPFYFFGYVVKIFPPTDFSIYNFPTFFISSTDYFPTLKMDAFFGEGTVELMLIPLASDKFCFLLYIFIDFL
jgi:hypothetical protein